MARSIRRVIDILLNKEIDEKKYEVKQKKVKTEKRKPMKPMTKDTELREINDSNLLYVPLLQHIGSTAIETVELGDYVKKYEKIGEIFGNISANIHSPVSGDVVDVVEHRIPNGTKVKTVIIVNDFQNSEMKLKKRKVEDLRTIKKEDIIKIIREAGIVGLGGAQFPTHIKYDTKFKKVETFIINGAECEPYLTSDYSLMKNFTKEILNGIKVIEKM